MARKNKLIKFTEILTFPNVYENFEPSNDILLGENGKALRIINGWRKDHFHNENPLILELACGGGEYSLALARRYPGKNFIGVDIKGARIWKGAKKALKENLKNVAFLRTRIEFITNFFHEKEVDEIWITFPDPFLKKSKKNRRLTSPAFLERYYKILKPGGYINLKTDSRSLYDYTLEKIREGGHFLEIMEKNIYAEEPVHTDLDIRTYYEKKHLEENKKIKFIRFRLNDNR